MAVRPRLGASLAPGGRCEFRVWAPRATQVELHVVAPQVRLQAMTPGRDGYFTLALDQVQPGTRYFYRLEGQVDRPDPASHSQPAGVHGPSEVVSYQTAPPGEPWLGRPLAELVIYELHVGTFTRQGTFHAVIDHLDELVDLGITALELMPVAEFPGRRNWGYDGVCLFAPHHAYGGPAGLQALVGECHRRGLAVLLDVVYNHLGPEGNYLADFGPYFSPHQHTPWGPALDFDGPHCDHVRRFFLENALHWIEDYEIDGFRLDAVQAIYDQRPLHFLAELSAVVACRARELGRPLHLIAESNLNDPQTVAPVAAGGWGLSAQWLDDFQRALQALLTGDRVAHYADFGSIEALAKAYAQGFVLDGQFSRYRGRRHGGSSLAVAPQQFVAFSHNHDTVGGRPRGERLSRLADFESLKLAAAATLLAPYLPLLFMGEEYGETAPFYYFTSHAHPGLGEAVHRGRSRDLAAAGWQGAPEDPQAEATFLACQLRRPADPASRQATLRRFYRRLLALRRLWPVLTGASRSETSVHAVGTQSLWVARRLGSQEALLALNFALESAEIAPPEPFVSGRSWQLQLHSAAAEWSGPVEAPEVMFNPGAADCMPPRSAMLWTRGA